MHIESNQNANWIINNKQVDSWELLMFYEKELNFDFMSRKSIIYKQFRHKNAQNCSTLKQC